MDTRTAWPTKVPWNKGKIVGQKAPLKLKDIWAIRSFRAPLTVMDVPDQIARDIYGFDLILLRPDMHIVWRGQQAPDDAALVAAIATGH